MPTTDLAKLAIQIDSASARIAALELDNMADSSEKAESATSHLTASSKLLRNAILTVVTALSGYKLTQYIKDSALLSARYDTMGVVLKQVGANAGYSAGLLDQFDSGLQQSGISMLESRSNLTKLIQAQIDLTKSTELARIAQDAAVIGNINSSEAFGRLVQGIQSAEVEILRNIGISVKFEDGYKKMADQLGKTTAQLSEQERVTSRVNQVIEYGSRISGVYSSAMDTVSKQLASTQRLTENLKVELGDAFGPTTQILVKTYANLIRELTDEIKDLKQSGDLDEWALATASKVVGAIDVIGIGIKGVGDLILGVRTSFGILISEYSQFRVSGLEIGLERNLKQIDDLNLKLEKGGISLFLAGGEEQVKSQIRALQERNVEIRKSIPEFNMSAEAGEKMATDNIESMSKFNATIDDARNKIKTLYDDVVANSNITSSSKINTAVQLTFDQPQFQMSEKFNADKDLLTKQIESYVSDMTKIKARAEEETVRITQTALEQLGFESEAYLDLRISQIEELVNESRLSTTDRLLLEQKLYDQLIQEGSDYYEEIERIQKESDDARILSSGNVTEVILHGLKKSQDAAGTWQERTSEKVQSFVDDTESALSNFLNVASDDFGSLDSLSTSIFNSISQKFAEMIAEMILEQTIFNQSTTGSGGLIGGLTNIFGSLLGGGGSTTPVSTINTGAAVATVAHSGWVVGSTAPESRIVSPGLFKTAPRLHNGLGANEYPAILERGERVLRKNERTGGTTVNINIASESGRVAKSSIRQLERKAARGFKR